MAALTTSLAATSDPGSVVSRSLRAAISQVAVMRQSLSSILEMVALLQLGGTSPVRPEHEELRRSLDAELLALRALADEHVHSEQQAAGADGAPADQRASGAVPPAVAAPLPEAASSVALDRMSDALVDMLARKLGAKMDTLRASMEA